MTLTVLVAVAAFIVLTGSVTQSRLETNRTVNANYRGSYDILVRPRGTHTAIESATGLVRPNYLSGIYGGITQAQLKTVQRIKGVGVAAPIAMVGELLETVDYPVDVTRYLKPDGRDVIRFSSRYISRHGAAASVGPSGYVYVTPSSLTESTLSGNPNDTSGPREKTGPDSDVPVCTYSATGTRDASPFTSAHLWTNSCWGRAGGGAGSGWSELGPGRYAAVIRWSFPVTLAAIDPLAESAMTGLNRTVSGGRYLTAQDGPTRLTGRQSGVVNVPVIASDATAVDEQLRLKVESLPPAAVSIVLTGGVRDATRAEIMALPGTHAGEVTVDAGDVLKSWLLQAAAAPPTVDGYWTPGQVKYSASVTGVLTPTPVSLPNSTWRSDMNTGGGGYAAVPPDAADTSFRTLTPHKLLTKAANADALAIPQLDVVGSFDPRKIAGYSALSKVPLETYEEPEAAPGDPLTRQRLGGKALAPDLNPAGYLQSPPLLITTLDSVRAFSDPAAFTDTHPTAPVSVIRVRVAGVEGADAASRERVRLVAQEIQRTTGLDVDVTIGSSPAPTLVRLPASRLGSPALTVSESWVKKGVATRIVQAINAKSAALFALILLACALVVMNAAGASVRVRRAELGVLACLGWRPATLFRSVLLELLVIGLAGGIGGALVALPVAAAVGSPLGPARTALAVPVAVSLALVAALGPAVRAAYASPANGVRPPGRASIRRVRLRGTATMSAAAVLRTPARTLTAALGLAVGVGTLTGLLTIRLAFRSQVVGSLLGNAVALQVRTPDLVAAATVALLGLVAIVDLLYLDVREQARYYAALAAAGWRDIALVKLVVLQAVIVGLLGATAGGALALFVVSRLGPDESQAVWTAVAVAVGGVVAAGLAALLPATMIGRLPVARLLAED